MDGSSQSTFALIEGLEDRRLLCGTASTAIASAGAALQSATASPAIRVPLMASPTVVKVAKAKPKKPVATTTPSLVRDYKGQLRTRVVTIGFGSFLTTFELNITAQTLTTLTGKIIIDGHGESRTLKGKLLSNGNFTFSSAAKGVIIGLTGHVTTEGTVITGTASLQILVGSKFRIVGNYAAKATSAT